MQYDNESQKKDDVNHLKNVDKILKRSIFYASSKILNIPLNQHSIIHYINTHQCEDELFMTIEKLSFHMDLARKGLHLSYENRLDSLSKVIDAYGWIYIYHILAIIEFQSMLDEKSCIKTGNLTSTIAIANKGSVLYTYITGMIHDIGKIILSSYDDRINNEHYHACITFLISHRWKLNKSISSALYYQYIPTCRNIKDEDTKMNIAYLRVALDIMKYPEEYIPQKIAPHVKKAIETLQVPMDIITLVSEYIQLDLKVSL
jgi:hypothetical protein